MNDGDLKCPTCGQDAPGIVGARAKAMWRKRLYQLNDCFATIVCFFILFGLHRAVEEFSAFVLHLEGTALILMRGISTVAFLVVFLVLAFELVNVFLPLAAAVSNTQER